MKRTTILILSMCTWALYTQAHTYVASSALRSGNIIKLQVDSTGVYSLSYEQIQSMGLDPQKVRILGYGGNLLSQDFTKEKPDDVPSVPFYMQVGSDGKFSAGDHILFYAQGPVGWEWNKNSFIFERTRNCYADFGCYFISDSAGEQKIITTKTDTLTSDSVFDVYSYTALQLHETDLRNLVDPENGQYGGGRDWYGEKMTQQASKLTIPFNFTDVDYTKDMVCQANVAAASTINTTIQVTVAGQSSSAEISAIPVSDFYTMAVLRTVKIRTAPTAQTLPVNLQYQTTASSAIAYLDYITMQVPCKMQLRGNHLMIRNVEHVGESIPSRYHLLGADSNTQIWDMTNPTDAYIVTTQWKGDTLTWLGDNMTSRLYLAIRVSDKQWATPSSQGKISNQDIHSRIRGKQHIIITTEDFRSAADELKQAHEQHSSEQWYVVSQEEVFNEFSSGTPDATAFRWMMKYLYDNYKETDKAPQSLLLFGDGSFDNRRLLKTSPEPYILTYQAINSLKETDAYATDDYFGWLEDNSGLISTRWDDKRARMQIGVGRLPVRTIEEAEGVAKKLSAYMENANPSHWKQQLCFLADDGDHSLHTTTANVAAELVHSTAPDFVINKIYLDSYIQESSASGESYPLAYNTFCNLLQSGIMLMDYAGHGSANNICSENFLTRKQVEAMSNTNQGVWMLATCSFAHFDQTNQSTAELAVTNPNGGALAVVSSDRTVYASENEIINKLFCEKLFYHTDPFTYPYTIGEALRLAKNENGDNMNKLPYVLLGDPSMRLNYPCQYQVVVSNIPDTLHALDLVRLKGYISNGDTLSSGRRDTVSYNGTLTITIYDKQQTIKTHDNDEPTESKKQYTTFEDYPNKLFLGKADVVDGHFQIEFRMPKDIRYNVGSGRITLYASGDDVQGHAEAIGHYEQFLVGGSNPWQIDDPLGPDMQIYLNSPLFSNGDNVNTTPHFYAELYDENGINTVGSGIGHDLQLIIDNSVKQTFILNDYYTAANNSYQNGTVSYILPELADGEHTLSFRAWDLLNNATTQSLYFTVDQTSVPEVQSLLVYPNPVSQFGTLNMVMVSDRPDETLKINITFYSLMGQKVWSANHTINDGRIAFDMTEASLPPGQYIYQFTIQTATQTSKKHNGRLIVY